MSDTSRKKRKRKAKKRRTKPSDAEMFERMKGRRRFASAGFIARRLLRLVP